MRVRVRVLDVVFERGEDEFNDELEARLEVRTTTRWSRRRGFGDDALEGLEEQCCALFDDDKGGDGNDKNAKKTKERKRRVSIQLRARFEGRDASFRCG